MILGEDAEKELRVLESSNFESYRSEKFGKWNRLIVWAYRNDLAPLVWLIKIFFHIQLPTGKGLPDVRFAHPYGIIVNDGVHLGSNCTLFHHVTLAGQRFGKRWGAPRLDDDVIVFPNSVIVGNVHIGSGAVIGAGSVVVTDIPSNSVVAGNPARVIAIIR